MNVDKFGRHTYTGMTIDKFGRHTARERLRGPKGEGFKVTDDGSFNIENKRLVNVLDPINQSDAATLKTVESQINSCIRLNKDTDQFDALNKRICSTGEPVEPADVVTKRYFEKHQPIRDDRSFSYSFHQFRVQDIAAPINDGDAVNLDFIKSKTLTKNKDDWDCNNKRLINVGRPLNDGDAVNKKYLTNQIPAKSKNTWSFGNKTLSQVGPPLEPADAINLAYLKATAIYKSAENRAADADFFRISNLAKPRELDDAVNKRYLKHVLAELSYAVYKAMHSRNRTTLVDRDEWETKVLDSSWETLFNFESPSVSDQL